MKSWLCIHTGSGFEEFAQQRLKARDIETLYPRTTRIRDYGWGRKKEIIIPFFRRYLFAYAELEHYLLAAFDQRREVLSTLDFGAGPVTVPEIVIDEIRSRMNPDGIITLDDAINTSGYKSDEIVMITGGPFCGMAGLFRRDIDEGARVVLFLKMLGREFEHSIDIVDTRQAFVSELAYI